MSSAVRDDWLGPTDPRVLPRIAGKLGALGAQLAILSAEALLAEAANDRARLQTQSRSLKSAATIVAHSFGLKVEVEGSLPRGASVLVANHLGYFDPLLIAALTPCAPIAKGELATWPILGARARDLGVLFVRRGDPMSGAVALRRGARALGAGVSVLAFPEGTTSYGDTVLRFQRGVFGLAMHARVQVVPIRIDYADRDACWVGDASFLPHLLAMSARRRIRARLRIGRAIAPSEARSADGLARLARFVIANDWSSA